MIRIAKTTVALLPLIAVAASATAAQTDSEDDRINAWFEEQFEEQLAFSPIQQTFLGRTSAGSDDFSVEAQDAQLEWFRASVAEMRASFDYEQLSEEARTSWDVWEYQLAQREAAVPFRSNGYVFEQMSAVHGFFPQLLIAFHRVQDEAGMEAYVARIGESGRALRQLSSGPGTTPGPECARPVSRSGS